MAKLFITEAGGKWSEAAAFEEEGTKTNKVPTAADDVAALVSGKSGDLKIDAAAECRSLDLLNYVKELAGASTLKIGTTTVNGSLALRLGSGMTNSYTGAITLGGTSTTETQGITTNGIEIKGELICSGTAGIYQFEDDCTIATRYKAAGGASAKHKINGKKVKTNGSLMELESSKIIHPEPGELIISGKSGEVARFRGGSAFEGTGLIRINGTGTGVKKIPGASGACGLGKFIIEADNVEMNESKGVAELEFNNKGNSEKGFICPASQTLIVNTSMKTNATAAEKIKIRGPSAAVPSKIKLPAGTTEVSNLELQNVQFETGTVIDRGVALNLAGNTNVTFPDEEQALNGLLFGQNNAYPPWLNTPRGLNQELIQPIPPAFQPRTSNFFIRTLEALLQATVGTPRNVTSQRSATFTFSFTRTATTILSQRKAELKFTFARVATVIKAARKAELTFTALLKRIITFQVGGEFNKRLRTIDSLTRVDNPFTREGQFTIIGANTKGAVVSEEVAVEEWKSFWKPLSVSPAIDGSYYNDREYTGSIFVSLQQTRSAVGAAMYIWAYCTEASEGGTGYRLKVERSGTNKANFVLEKVVKGTGSELAKTSGSVFLQSGGIAGIQVKEGVVSAWKFSNLEEGYVKVNEASDNTYTKGFIGFQGVGAYKINSFEVGTRVNQPMAALPITFIRALLASLEFAVVRGATIVKQRAAELPFTFARTATVIKSVRKAELPFTVKLSSVFKKLLLAELTWTAVITKRKVIAQRVAELPFSVVQNRLIVSRRKAELLFTVALPKLFAKILKAELKFTVAVRPVFEKILEAFLEFTRVNNQKVKHQIATSLEFTKVLATTQFKKLTLELKFTVVPKRITIPITRAALSFTVNLVKVRPRPLQAILTFAKASLTKRTIVRNLQAQFEFLIKLRETTYKTLRASLGYAVTLQRRIKSARKAQLLLQGHTKRVPVRALAATLAFTQRTNRRIRHQAIASLTFAEAEIRKIFGYRLKATLGFTGSVKDRTVILVRDLQAKLVFVTLTTHKVRHQLAANLNFTAVTNHFHFHEFVQKLAASLPFTVQVPTVKIKLRKVLEAALRFRPELDMEAYETELQDVGPYLHAEVGTSELITETPQQSIILWTGRKLVNGLSLYPYAKFKRARNEFTK